MQLIKKINRIKGQAVVPFIALICLLIQLFSNNLFEFHRDELLYFSLGQHLDFGYYSVPPFTGLIAFMSTKLFG